MRLGAVPDRSLDRLLAGVSRSFYLSLAILPRAVRTQLSVAYLLARAADTIADTRVVAAARRLELLAGLRAAVLAHESDRAGQADAFADQARGELLGPTKVPAERILLERLGDCLRLLGRFDAGDRARTQRVLGTLLDGMAEDLRRFPDGGFAWLETPAELDAHCYRAAGCVGEFWTEMIAAHVPSVRRLARPDLVARGVRLGKALQMVNVLRDAPADLADGRCYLPRAQLALHGLSPEALRDPARRRGARPLFAELLAIARAHVDAAWPYVLAIPASEPRLRLAAVWPLWIGLATARKLRAADDPFDPTARIKIARGEVYRIVAESSLVVASTRLLSVVHARRAALPAGNAR